MELIYLSKMELKMKNRTYITKQWNIKLFELKLEEEKIKKKKNLYSFGLIKKIKYIL